MRIRAFVSSALLFTTVLATTTGSAHASDPPHGPQTVDLEHARCSLCEMRIAKRRYVAQLHTEDGAVLNFDDPGCLFRFLIERRPRVHARYLMGPDGRWIAGRDVAFVEGERTPMGFGLAAVRRGTPNAISWHDAWRRVQRRLPRRPAR